MKIFKNKKFLIICAIAVIVITLGVFLALKLTPEKSESGVILQEDFNEGYGDFLGDAYVNDDEATSFSYLSEGGPDGSGCLKLESFEANDARFITSVNFEKNVIYKLSCDIYVEKMTGYAPCAGLSVYSLEATGFQFVETVTEDWQNFTIYFKTAKTETLDLCLRLGYFSRDTEGVCYFDNVLVETVDSVPDGAFLAQISSSSSSTQTVTTDAEYNENTYYDMRIISLIIAGLSLLGFGIWLLYVKATKTKEVFTHEFNLNYTLIGLFIIALAFRLILSLTYYQCDIDVNLFKYWGEIGASKGISNIYTYCEEVGSVCDYPPVFIYFLTLFSMISGGNASVYTLLVKILPILSDLFLGAFITQLAYKEKKFSNHVIVFIAAIWLFNPMIILDSSCWGQVDSLLTVFVVLAAYFLTQKKYFYAGLFVGLGIMLKPQMIIFLPIVGSKLIYDFIKDLKNKSYNYIWKGLLGGLVGLFVPAVPFLNMGLAECKILGIEMKLPWICSLFAGTLDSYAYASVNCYNFWFLIGKNWVSDSEKIGNVSIYTWGMLAIVLACVICLGAFIYLLVKKKDSKVNSLVYGMGAMVFMIVSCFGPRMHERYFFPALALSLIAFILSNNKLFVYNYGLTSTFGFISVHEIMIGILVGGSIRSEGAESSAYADFYWPSLTTYRGIIAFAMVAAAIISLVSIIVYVLKENRNEKY